MNSAEEKMNLFEYNSMLDKLNQNDRYKRVIEMIRTDPSNYKGYLSFGAILEEEEDYLTAIKILRKCIDVNDLVIFAYIRTGVCYFYLGDENKSFIYMMTAWMLKHANERALINSTLNGDENSGAIFANMAEMILKDFTPIPSSLKSGGESAGSIFNLGCYCIDNKYMPGAIVCFELTVRVDPNYYQGYSNLGTCLSKNGQFSESIRPLIKALMINPLDEVSYLGLGHSYLVLDYPYFSIPCFEQALKIRPGYENAQIGLNIATESNRISIVKDLAKGLYAGSRMAGLSINPESWQNLQDAFNLHQMSSGTNHSDVIRGYGAGLETELRSFLGPIYASTKTNPKTVQSGYQHELTLGSLARTIGNGFIDLVGEIEHSDTKSNVAVRAKLIQDFYASEEDLQMLANNIGTVAGLRNRAAHGEILTATEAKDCRFYVQLTLELITRFRLNSFFKKHYKYPKMGISKTINGKKIQLI